MLVLQFLLPSTNRHIGSSNQQPATTQSIRSTTRTRIVINNDNSANESFQSSHAFSSVVPAAEEAPPAVNNMEAEELPAPTNMMMPRSTIARDGTQTFMI